MIITNTNSRKNEENIRETARKRRAVDRIFFLFLTSYFIISVAMSLQCVYVGYHRLLHMRDDGMVHRDNFSKRKEKTNNAKWKKHEKQLKECVRFLPLRIFHPYTKRNPYLMIFILYFVAKNVKFVPFIINTHTVWPANSAQNSTLEYRTAPFFLSFTFFWL